MTNSFAKKKLSLQRRARKGSMQLLAAAGLLVGAGFMQSCEKDILTGQPEWLGNSIYERLQDGITVDDGSRKSFNYTIRLINDLNYQEVLSRTGSKTLFVSSDEAYDAWFKSNSWNVGSYDDLTLSQKKQLLNGAMINNAYLLELMSNTPASGSNDPDRGKCMRRETAASVYDNIPVYPAKDFPMNPEIADAPVNKAWEYVRSAGKDLYILKDATVAPMIHFLPEFMAQNGITDDDLNKISNGQSTSTKDSWINGKKVISKEQTCKNGYVYVIDGVMESNQSMAEIINNTSNTKMWASLLKRFSVPVAMNKTTQDNFWRLYPEHKNVDSLYNLRYLNKSENHALRVLPSDPTNVINDNGVLAYDPGWNQYVADGVGTSLQSDAACMLVPTDAALTEWFENGAGKTLREEYGSWDAISDETLAKLINVNMVQSFTSSVPSKFESIQDDAQRSFGITKDDVEYCYMGCNGVVYVTNKVFQPSAFSSVLNPPTLKSEKEFSVIAHALTGSTTGSSTAWLDFTPYLNAMDARFSLIIPFNFKSSLTQKVTYPVVRFVDPASYGLPQQWLLEFYYDGKKVSGYAYSCNLNADGSVSNIAATGKSLTSDIIADRLYNLIDNSIIIEDITADKTYYKTKAGSVMKVTSAADGKNFQSGLQLETGEMVNVPQRYTYDTGSKGNGITYGTSADADLDASHVDIPMTASKSVYQMLKDEADNGGDHLFFDLLYNKQCPLWKTIDASEYCCVNPEANYNISLFDNYNYTVYVPTDEAIQELITSGELPTWDDYADERISASKKSEISQRIANFLRYHIQDNSVFVGGEKYDAQLFESGKLNPETNKFYILEVTQNGSELTVKDASGDTRHVITSGAEKTYYNRACREYWIKGPTIIQNSVKSVDVTKVRTSPYLYPISAASDAVVHKIDGVLFYDKAAQTTKW